MKQSGVNWFIFCLVLLSCSHPRWVAERYRSNVTHNYMTVYNDTALGFQFNIFALAFNIPEQDFRKYLPDFVNLEIKKQCRLHKQRIVFIAADTSLSPNQFYYIGLLGNDSISGNYTFKKAKSGSTYYLDQFISFGDSIYIGKASIPLANKSLTIFCFDLKKSKRLSSTDYSLSFFKEVFNNLLYNNLKTMKEFEDQNKPSIFEYFNSVAKKSAGNYLAIIQQLNEVKQSYPDSSDQYFLYEFLATQHAMLDDLVGVKEMLEKQDFVTSYTRKTNRKISPYVYNELKWDNANSIILKSAKDFRVLMVNESHFDWRHRYFITTLLDSLYGLGYRRLALEALDPGDDSLNKRGYPIQESGLYTSEPHLANLIRQALQKGFSLLSYEDTLNSKDREYNQAHNLYTLYKKDTASGLVVLAGYGHIIEDTTKDNLTMAGHFKKMLGKDILTIDQTQYDDLFYETSFFPEKGPGYFASIGSKGSSGDITVINNIQHQPLEYLPAKNGFRLYTINIPLEKYEIKDATLFLFIYPKKEYSIYNNKCVPFFCRQVKEGENLIRVNLLSDQYIAVIKNKDGVVISSSPVPNPF